MREAPPSQETFRVTVPAGTRIRVRLNQAISTAKNQPGDRFTASLDEPIVVGGRAVVPKGTEFSGHVVAAEESGRLRGRAALGITLDAVNLRGRSYPIDTSDVDRTSGSHKKRNAVLIGGGSGLGALIGGLAGGGKGALIGALAGAGAGAGGAAATGKKNVVVPAETLVTFSLSRPLEL